MPSPEEISEEGFGFFRGTWFIGHVPVRDAQATLAEEGAIIDWLDRVATTPEEFEQLASAIESQDTHMLKGLLETSVAGAGIARLIDDDQIAPLDSLEIGVAGLTHALSAIRCLTAASCRWHITDRSWSDCPVVLFAAPPWRAEILADLVAGEGCGLGSDRRMLTVYGRSILDTHRLAERILADRARFRRKPHRWRTPRSASPRKSQLNLLANQDPET